MANTGRLIYRKLEQYNTETGQATGVIKDNVEGTEGYVPPIERSALCPVEGQTPYLNIVPTYQRIPHMGGMVNIGIRSNISWEASFTNTSFVNLFGASLEGTGFGSISFSVDPHTFSGGSRYLYIDVISVDGSLEAVCEIEQDPYNDGGLDPYVPRL